MGFADWGKGDKVATASHILVKDRPTALAIKERIERGEVSFAEAAREFSTCGSAAAGGDLGSFPPGRMVKEFDAYCFDASSELGAIGVVETEFGVHLIQLVKQSMANSRNPRHFDGIEGGRVYQAPHIDAKSVLDVLRRVKMCLRRCM